MIGNIEEGETLEKNLKMKYKIWDSYHRKYIPQCDVCIDGNGTISVCNLHSEVRKVEDLKVLPFSGKTDRNGVELYKGDVVQAKQFDDYHVGQKEKPQTVMLVVESEVWTNLSGHDMGGEDGATWYEDLKKIGNIFENKDLLLDMKEAKQDG